MVQQKILILLKNLIGKITEITCSFETNPMIIPIITPRTNLIIRVSPFFFFHTIPPKIIIKSISFFIIYFTKTKSNIKNQKYYYEHIFLEEGILFFKFVL